MLKKKSFISILVIVLAMMLIVGCSEIAPNISLELGKAKPDSLPQQALDNQQATAHIPEQAQAELPFGEEAGGAVPISIVLSWGIYEANDAWLEFQGRLIDPEGNTTYAHPLGGVNLPGQAIITVDTFIPGTYYYYVSNFSENYAYPYGNVLYKDMSLFEVKIIDTINDLVLATFNVSDATGESIQWNSNWKVFSLDSDTGVITTFNQLDCNYAPPW